MSIEYKQELKTWLIYFGTIFFSLYIHEIGHCIPAWVNGYWAVPTPAKEYSSSLIPSGLIQYISLGGIISTILLSLLIFLIYIVKSSAFNSAILAGAIAMPGAYTLRFILAGRGHDATEFQEAQSALGFNYSGHSLDWIFLILFLAGLTIWIKKSKPRSKVLGRLLMGFVLTLIFIVGLQSINNAIFDPVFQSK
jgi:hypothetical protein